MNNFFENTDIKEILRSLININDFVEIFRILKNNDNIINIGNSVLSDYFNFELQNKKYNKVLFSFLREVLIIQVYFIKEEIIKNLNIGCRELLNYTLLGNLNDDIKTKKLNNSYEYNENISEYYINKLVYDSTKNKNDILRFENCIKNEISDDIIKNNPAFLSYLIDMTHNFNKSLRNGTYFEDFYFTFGFCFPQGDKSKKNEFIIDGKVNYYFCEESDYTYIMENILKLFIYVNNKEEIISIELKKNRNFWGKSYNLIPFFIFLIPIFIYFFLKLYNIIIIKKKAKVLMVYQSRNKKFGNDENDNDNIE
jgi:hypothetical protein